MTVAGLASLAVFVIAAVFVVTRFVFSHEPAVAVAVGLSLAVASLWYMIPLKERNRARRWSGDVEPLNRPLTWPGTGPVRGQTEAPPARIGMPTRNPNRRGGW